MKNFIVFVALILLVISSLSYNFLQSKKHTDNYLNLKEKLYAIKVDNTIIEKDLIFEDYIDFNEISLSSKKIEDKLYIVKSKHLFEDNIELIEDLDNLQIKNRKRDKLIFDLTAILKEYHKNYSKIYNLSFKDKKYNRYLKLNANSDITTLKKIEKEIRPFIESIKNIHSTKADISMLKIDEDIENINNKINQIIKDLRDDNKKTILTTIFLFIVIIIIFAIYYMKEYKKNLMTSRFRSAIENSDNIIVITDYDQRIIYVNQSFTDSTGYTLNEIKGKTPSILKSSVMPKTFYKELNNTIYSGKKWQGEFINVDKNGKTRYEKGSILPILNNSGKIEYFLSIKLDITKEVEADQKIKEHEQTILHQSKMASMGEMLENIAHQWRQPLSTITTVASGMSMQKEVNILSDEAFFKSIDTIMENSEYLSKTIDDFRNFFKSEKDHVSFNVKQSIIKALNISNSKMKSKFIQNITSLTDLNVVGIDGEIMQVILNLYSNSADAFDVNDNKNHYIFTELYEKNGAAVIKVRDSAGGIPDEFLNKIFEPYFTTKHKAQGTGIGLYMSHEIIKNTFKGAIDVHNVTYQHNGEKYTGAEFIIKIPITNPTTQNIE